MPAAGPAWGKVVGRITSPVPGQALGFVRAGVQEGEELLVKGIRPHGGA